MAEFYLCGYHYTAAAPSKPYCLLYSDIGRKFSVKLIQQSKKKRQTTNGGNNCFRHAFVNNTPPAPFTWVRDDIFDRHQIVPAPEIHRRIDGLTHDRTPYVMTESVIDHLFRKLPPLSEVAVPPTPENASQFLTEDEAVTRFIFKPQFVRELKERLVAFLKFTRPTDRTFPYSVPTSPEHLLITFEPVDVHGDCDDDGARGPDDVIRRHVILKHVIQTLICPFVHVADNESIQLERALSHILPTGSTGKGAELALSDPADESYYRCSSSNLAYRGSDMTKIDPSEIPDDAHHVVDITPPPETSHHIAFRDFFVSRDEPPSIPPTPNGATYHDNTTLGWLRYIAFVHTSAGASADKFFSNGNVIYHTNERHEPFAVVDFSNYYASVIRAFDLDPYMSRIHDQLIEIRCRHPQVKGLINISIGKRQKTSLRWYNITKQLSVAVMLHTITENGPMVCGATTDGILLRSLALPTTVKCPQGFSMKVDFVPDTRFGMVTVSQNMYAGVDARTHAIVHRGFIGMRTTMCPKWFRSVVEIVLRAFLKLKSKEEKVNNTTETMKVSLARLLETKTSVSDLVLPDCDASFTTQKLPLVVYHMNDLLPNRFQIYTVVDGNIDALPFCDDVALPDTVNVFCAKQLNVKKYSTIITTLLTKIYENLTDAGNKAEAFQLFSAANGTLQKYLDGFPQATSVYPGGIGI
ncbi:hypothetical protein ElyMa_003964900 [Elysia marginata]|uniref:DNA-directed DNA polymerase n=1 Tax=Elysia marginata TaxID=1093978 RepID=A0AAV4FW39_9GAST|nr:hypothetical protein ElyMa_003964900 [Elysia marginata]